MRYAASRLLKSLVTPEPDKPDIVPKNAASQPDTDTLCRLDCDALQVTSLRLSTPEVSTLLL